MTSDNRTAVPIVDSHLDLAENVIFVGRDLTLSVEEIRQRENRTQEQATVSLPELRRAGIAVVFATLFAGRPFDPNAKPRPGTYHSPEEAEANALEQVALYQTWEKQGWVRLIGSVADLDHHMQLWTEDRKPGLILLMEGADAIVSVNDLPKWWNLGLRMIGLTWGDTRYGTGMRGGSTEFKPGGLTPNGVALLQEMAGLGFIWDISHLTEAGVRQGLELDHPRICASHANAQALVPTNRHLSDDIIRAVAERDGVIGVIPSNEFLDPRWDKDRSIVVTLEHVRRHAEHIADLVGWGAVGIGSDLDGGTGLEESPVEIDTIADLHKLGSIAPEEHRDALLGGNWLRFLRSALPGG